MGDHDVVWWIPSDQIALVVDDADQPEELRDLLPVGPGHVIVTSRNHWWQSIAAAVEVDVFSREESRDFLTRRVPGITERECICLADKLSDRSLGLEQAGALQVESGMSVGEYLELLVEESGKVLAENSPADYPVGVAAAWSLSMARLEDRPRSPGSSYSVWPTSGLSPSSATSSSTIGMCSDRR